jgi:lipopolysaccharide transport system ATP-binding protein
MSERKASIKVRDLYKEFTLGFSGAGSVKTALLWWHRRRFEKLQVLNGVSLDVKSGETVALIGKNGAGKSTLLSLIARVYKPTSGSIEIEGRVAPLLELGAGFHPDLTGRENVFFNGVILGLTRKQILERTEQIVEFAEMEAQIDVPVRTYSSGMLARLGFSVAVHVDADVLIVDEVLAVGDYRFEQKCYARLAEFKAAGGAILFVSHDLDAVQKVADRCIWLEGGKVVMNGSPAEVLPQYLGEPLSAGR